MAEALGRNAVAGIGVESTAGTAVSAALQARLADLTVNEEVTRVRIEDLSLGVSGYTQARYTQQIRVSGSAKIVGYLSNGAIGMVMRACIGGAWASPVGSGPYTHVLNTGLDLPSITLRTYRDNGDQGDVVAGLKVLDYTIELSTGGLLTISFNYEAMSRVDGTLSVSLAAHEDPLVFHEFGALSFNSTTNILSSMTISGDNGVEGIRAFGSASVSRLLSTGIRSIKLSATRFKDSDEWSVAQVAGTESDVHITGTRGTYSARFELFNAVIIDGVGFANSSVGLVEETAVFEARDDGTDPPFKFTLINGDATAEAS